MSTNQKLINGKICPGCSKHIHHHFILHCSHYNFSSPLDSVKNVFFSPPNKIPPPGSLTSPSLSFSNLHWRIFTTWGAAGFHAHLHSRSYKDKHQQVDNLIARWPNWCYCVCAIRLWSCQFRSLHLKFVNPRRRNFIRRA